MALSGAGRSPVVFMPTEKGKNFCWGGGTAIRRSIFDESGVLDEWRNSVSDDYSLTRALARNNRSIVFLPECLILSYVATAFPGFLGLTTRQILIPPVYSDTLSA